MKDRNFSDAATMSEINTTKASQNLPKTFPYLTSEDTSWQKVLEFSGLRSNGQKEKEMPIKTTLCSSKIWK